MKKFTKIVVGVFCALLLATTIPAWAQTKATIAPVAVQTTPSLFNGGELGLSLASGYNLGTAGDVVASAKARTLFTQPYTLNFNAGAFYFPWRNLGVEANVPFYQSKGVSVSEVQAGILLRAPLAKKTPLFKNLAPYIGVGGVYDWQTAQDWAYIGKAGLEVRLNKKWGLFVEGQYRNYELKNMEKGSVSLNGGLKLVF
jgi:hypothetical protein